jgi:hypothetical protein
VTRAVSCARACPTHGDPMLRNHPALVLALCLLVPAAAHAQIGRGEVGLYLATQNGSGGTICGPTFTCSYVPATLTRGETANLVLRGVFGMPYIVILATGAQNLCLPIPEVHNQLMFVPMSFPFVGILDQNDMILRCPGGLKQLALPVPQELAPGTQILLQALVWSYLVPPGQVPTLTQAVQATVR